MKTGMKFLLMAALATVLTLGVIGCGRKGRIIELDPRFSMNLAKVPYWFPDPKVPMGPVENEVLERYGPPDFIRFWWREDGSMITSSDLSGRDRETIQGNLDNMKKSWIYVNNNIEVVFSPNRMSIREQPIDEITGLLCQWGDPGRRTHLQTGGRNMETWIWVDHGWKATIENGRIVSKDRIGPGTGSGTYLLK